MKTELHLLADEELVRLYQGGMNEAFVVLLSRHKDKIYNYILFLTKNEALSDDLFQDTFIKVVVCLRGGNYSENGKFSAWLSRIAHNLVMDYYRRVSGENLFSKDASEYDVLNDAKLCEGSIEDDLIHSQRLKEVVALLRYLPKSQREVVEMRYYKNMSFSEIAATTGVSINTALGRMRYALLHLKGMAKQHNMVM